jgi:cytoskeletal protein RodZ
VTLDQVIERTKISRRFLEAIEAGRYDELPGGVFSRSYLKQYAEAVGLETRLLLEHYEKKAPNERGADVAAPVGPRWMKSLLPGL